MENGFIYPTFDYAIRCLRYISLVEFFKFVAIKLFSKNDVNSKKCVARIAIDVFQVFKWVVIISLFIFGVNATISKYIVYYFIWVNLYTYFLFHVWGSQHQQIGDIRYIRCRFINSIMAIAFFLFCYTYLYMYHFRFDILWANDNVDFINSIYLSVANAFTLTYGGFAPKTQGARILFMTELINTFVFFTIILTNSIPNPVKEK